MEHGAGRDRADGGHLTKRLEGREASSTAAFLRALEGVADGVHVVDARQRIIFWNQAAERLTGFRRGDVVGRYCYDVIAGGDYEGHPFCRRNCPTIRAAVRGRGVPNYDVCAQTARGDAIWLNVSVLPAPDPAGTGYLAVHLFRDVTRRRQAEILAQRTIEAVSRYSSQGEPEKLGPCPVPEPRLTRREMDVLRLLACGSGIDAIAETLGIATSTVRNHIEHILAKFGVHSRLEAVVYAAQRRLV